MTTNYLTSQTNFIDDLKTIIKKHNYIFTSCDYNLLQKISLTCEYEVNKNKEKILKTLINNNLKTNLCLNNVSVNSVHSCLELKQINNIFCKHCEQNYLYSDIRKCNNIYSNDIEKYQQSYIKSQYKKLKDLDKLVLILSCLQKHESTLTYQDLNNFATFYIFAISQGYKMNTKCLYKNVDKIEFKKHSKLILYKHLNKDIDLKLNKKSNYLHKPKLIETNFKQDCKFSFFDNESNCYNRFNKFDNLESLKKVYNKLT